jgi:hypothetical protein
MKPTPKAFARHGRHGDEDGQAEQADPIAVQLQWACHRPLGFIQVPGFPSAIETRSFPTLARSYLVVLPSMSLGPPLHSLGSRTPAVMLFNATRGLSPSR